MTSRLTEKNKTGYSAQYDKWSGDNTLDIINKCGKYEDIEEELGIDLITLVKVFTDGYYCKGWADSILQDRVYEFRKYYDGWGFSSDDGLIYYISDYGKTWALTKEELE